MKRPGNFHPENETASFPASASPLFSSYPLTDYHERIEHGRQILNLDDLSVEQMRSFSIENKK